MAAEAGVGKPRDDTSALVVVAELSPCFWARRAVSAASPGAPGALGGFEGFVGQLIAFVGSRQALHARNRVAVLGLCGCHAEFVLDTARDTAGGGIVLSAAAARKELLASVDALLAREERKAEAGSGSGATASPSQLVVGLSKALCWLHSHGAIEPAAPPGGAAASQLAALLGRRRGEAAAAAARRLAAADGGDGAAAAGSAPARLAAHGRILCLTGLPDDGDHYVALTNAVFSAQKAGVPVDALMLDPQTSSSYLKAAAKMTGGVYAQTPGAGAGLLQAMLSLVGADGPTRAQLAQPPPPAYDFRPVDFVTKERVEIGYVCSVCLSIFGTHVAKCPTCATEYGSKVESGNTAAAVGR